MKDRYFEEIRMLILELESMLNLSIVLHKKAKFTVIQTFSNQFQYFPAAVLD